MSRTKKFFFYLIGISATSLLSLLLLELVFGNWLKDDGWKATSRLNIVRDRQITYQVENLYGSAIPTVLYSRNKYGLRDSCKSPKEIDILTIGGSTTDQRYIGDGQTYQDVLQSYIEAKLNKRVCVSNAGVDGHSTFGHLASFHAWLPLIPDLKPKFFLLYVGINDAGLRTTPNAGFDYIEGPRESRLKSVLREKSALYGLLSALRDIFSGINISSAYAGHSKRPPSATDYTAESASENIDTLIQANTAAFSQRFKAILSEVKKYDARPICVSQPHLFVSRQNGKLKGTQDVFQYKGKMFNGLDYYKSITALNEAMKKLCAESDGFFIDVASKNFARNDFYDAVHMTPAGAAKLGKYLFDELEQQQVIAKLQ